MLRAPVIMWLGASLSPAACVRTQAAPAEAAASASPADRGDCQGHVLELLNQPLQIHGADGVQGYSGLTTLLLPDGRLTDYSGLVGQLDESGCFHDPSGALIARWGTDGRLLGSATPGWRQVRLNQRRLELFMDGKLQTTWTVEGARILRNGAPVASIVPAENAAAEMALRVLLLPDLTRTARTRPVE